MKKINITQKALSLSIMFGLLTAIFLSVAGFDTACEDLRGNILRLHIIANSNSAIDQKLKLEIRDGILSRSEELLGGADCYDAAVINAKASLTEVEELANDIIKEKGFDYTASARIGDSYFETREYESFTLPAGVYKSLIIDLGKSEGQNWWCVIFPEICLPAASDAALTDSVSEDSASIATHSERYIMKFKTVEIYENIKNFIFR